MPDCTWPKQNFPKYLRSQESPWKRFLYQISLILLKIISEIVFNTYSHNYTHSQKGCSVKLCSNKENTQSVAKEVTDIFLWINSIHAKHCSAGWTWSKPPSFKAGTLHARLPGQYASTSSFWAEVRVGEPSSDSGIRGLSTNFAFLRGAKDKKEGEGEGEGEGKKKKERERKIGRKEERKRKEKQGKRRERET